jgi:ergothioneine biosynthesis protein EgtB
MNRLQLAAELTQTYLSVRQFTERLVQPLSAEDCGLQSMAEVSPIRWHLAHTTWFFETFLLAAEPGYQPFDERFHFLFNSYYNTLGPQFPREQRGLISRPGLQRIVDYRQRVDSLLMERLQCPLFVKRSAPLLQIGLQHEQQHQELILTDIKHVLSCNPLYPEYQAFPLDTENNPSSNCVTPQFIGFQRGVYEVGHSGKGFAFDNESPRHSVFLEDFELADHLVTCGDFLEFMSDGGYQRPELWLSLGWSQIQTQGWQAPLYWQKLEDRWHHFTLSGLRPVDPWAPVVHVSFFEADAYARWRDQRLPTEQEWEVAAQQTPPVGDEQFADWLLDRSLALHPTRSRSGLCGGVWQWTASNYLGYPGYRPPPGAVGEYNGKFMCDQHVLRGGSVATHSTHIRTTYRNFFPATTRWQFTGIRLAR